MTTSEIAQMIASIGLPYAYDHFEESESPGGPPFICFTYPESENFFADGRVYQKIKQLQIELYTDEKDFSLEEAIENMLDEADLGYDSYETYLDSEKMYMVRWETEVLITPEDDDSEDESSDGDSTDG